MSTLLALAQVTRFYGPRLIFKNVSLEVRSGTVTLLAGANGAGKSTLLKIMAGLTRPSSGEVHTGQGTGGAEPVIGYLGHQTFIYPDLTALENLRFWASLYSRPVRKADFDDILRRVELAPFAEEKAGGFSRGMSQRLNLARVFLLRPDVLLLDEPGTGLDTRSSAILHREVAAASAEGAGVVWITHTLDSDLSRADIVALLENKILAFYGPAGDYEAQAGKASSSGGLLPDPFPTRRAQGGELC